MWKKAGKNGVAVRSNTVIGYPKETIHEYAKEKTTNLIGTGSVGKSGVKRVVLGGTTENVIRSVSVPVLTVPSSDE